MFLQFIWCSKGLSIIKQANYFLLDFQYVVSHLSFLQYVLQEGVLYLHWNRAKEIWGVLVASPEACIWDKEVGESDLSFYAPGAYCFYGVRLSIYPKLNLKI